MNTKSKKRAARTTGLAATADSVRKVRFQCHAPEAKCVCVAGTFNDWQADATSLQQQAEGLWTVETLLERIRAYLAHSWAIQHATLEPEVNGCGSTDLIAAHKVAHET